MINDTFAICASVAGDAYASKCPRSVRQRKRLAEALIEGAFIGLARIRQLLAIGAGKSGRTQTGEVVKPIGLVNTRTAVAQVHALYARVDKMFTIGARERCRANAGEVVVRHVETGGPVHTRLIHGTYANAVFAVFALVAGHTLANVVGAVGLQELRKTRTIVATNSCVGDGVYLTRVRVGLTKVARESVETYAPIAVHLIDAYAVV